MSSTGKRKAPGADVAEGKGAVPVALPPMPSTHEVVPGTGESKPVPSAPMGQGRRRRTQKNERCLSVRLITVADKMASAVKIPIECSIYDWIRKALNERRHLDAFLIYDTLSFDERRYFQYTYPQLFTILYEVYVREKMTTATHSLHI